MPSCFVLFSVDSSYGSSLFFTGNYFHVLSNGELSLKSELGIFKIVI